MKTHSPSNQLLAAFCSQFAAKAPSNRLPPLSTAMKSPAPRRSRTHTRRTTAVLSATGSAGFSIIQVMMSMAIGSIVIAASIPKVKKAEASSRATVVASDLRTFVTAFETYAQEKGGWPAEVAAGEMPSEMADRLRTTGWQKVTPMGGQYNWESNQMHGGVRYKAALSISETAIAPLEVNEDVLLEIDRLIDDGNLATGNFRTGVNNDPLFIIQQ
jgi:type II secretory pathway pseudopilin PulG